MAILVLQPARTLPAVVASRPVRTLSAVGLAGAAGAFGFMVLLHLLAGESVAPVTSMLSHAGLVPGVGWMFFAGVLCLALVAVCAQLSVRTSGLPTGKLSVVATALIAPALVLVAAFPTDPEGTAVLSLSAQVHRYAAAVATAAAPVAALGVAAALPRCAVGRRAIRAAAMLTLSAVLVTGVAVFLPGSFDAVRGLIQRGLLLSELVLLALLVVVPTNLTRSVSPGRS